MSSQRTVSVRLTASTSDYMTKMSAAGKATQDLANKVEQAKARTAAGYKMIGGVLLAGGVAIAAGFGEAIKQATDFDAKMALVQTLSKATACEMTRLRAAAMTSGQAFGYNAGQVADAEAELIKAGISVKDIIGGALTGALTLAAAGQENVADATNTAAIAMTQFKLKGKDVPHIADLLAAGADKALGSVHDLSMGLQSGGLVAARMGMSIESTIGTLAAFAQAGLQGETGGTDLRQMLLKLTAASGPAQAMMEKLGLTLYDEQGKFVGIVNLAGQLQTKMGNLTLAERQHAEAVIFGSRAINAANVLYQNGAAGMEKWIRTVNDAGFAQVQAAGKLNSLSGDWTKFTSALQNAFIGAGEGAQGPLRTLVQDATDVVDAWNALPEPVQRTVEALTGVTGAAALLAGGLLVLVPKITATRDALVEMGISADAQKAALAGLGKVGVYAAAIAGFSFIVDKLAHSLGVTIPQVGATAQSLETLGRTSQVSGALVTLYGKKFQYLRDDIESLTKPSTAEKLGQMFDITRMWGNGINDIDLAKQRLSDVDAALAQLVSHDQAEVAREAFDNLSTAWVKMGGSAEDLGSRLKKYGAALNANQTAATTAANAQKQFTSAMQGAAAGTQQASDAAKNYNDTLHAMADPIFGLQQALSDLNSKQQAAATAARKYGADSKQARQANIDLASAALNVTGAATTLSGALRDGSTSARQMRTQLAEWVKQGVITRAQAAAIATELDHVIGRAHALDGADVNFGVHANGAQAAKSMVDQIIASLTNLDGKTAQFYVHGNVTSPSGPLLGPLRGGKHAAGGTVHGPGTGTSDSIPAWLSNGEYVMPAASTAKYLPMLEAMRAAPNGMLALASGGRAGRSFLIRHRRAA